MAFDRGGIFNSALGGMDIINQMWADRGNDHNAEWAGANPEEYWMRKYGEALAWKRGKMSEQAEKDALYTKRIMEEQRNTMEGELRGRKEAFQRQANESKSNISANYANYANLISGLKSTYGQKLAGDSQAMSQALTNLLGAYDTAYGNVQSKLNSSSQNYESLLNQSQQSANNFGLASQGFMNETPRMLNPELYTPDLGTMMGYYGQAIPTFLEGQKKYEETYGGWNDAKLQEVTQTPTQQFQQAQNNTTSGINNLSGILSNANVPGGVFGGSQYDTALAQQNSLNQQIRSMEQGILSQINDMFNIASTFANNANNAFNTEKANRLQERGAMQAQQSEDELTQKASQFENNAAQQVSTRREQTGLAFNPEQQLLSLLTRGI